MRVNQKILGPFKSEKEAQQFVVIRSVYDTFRKNKGKTFDALSSIVIFVPENLLKNQKPI